jgi:hypothetical protein
MFKDKSIETDNESERKELNAATNPDDTRVPSPRVESKGKEAAETTYEVTKTELV